MSDEETITRPPEFQPGGPIRTALIDGVTFTARPVQYAEVDGLAIFEGDIVLGRVEDLEADTQACRRFERRSRGLRGDVVPGDWSRWPGGVIPYEIDPALPEPARVTDAIAHWHERTPLRLVPRSGEGDYLCFIPADVCDSPVGRQGGRQEIRLAPGCDRGSAIHEIFHTVGAWHEQSREDRDFFVQVLWENIEPAKRHNFDQHINDNDDVGPYDYDSIMHYRRDAFSANGGYTIVPLQYGAEIGQRSHLSDLDIEAVKYMYPGLAWPTKDPKERAKDEPKTENPKDGLKDPFGDPKTAADDRTIKEPKLDSPVKERPKEQWLDPLMPAKAAPWKDPIRNWGRGGVPFVLATGTSSAGTGSGAGSPYVADAVLSAQLLQVLATFQQLHAKGLLDAAGAEAWRSAAQAYARVAGRPGWA